jgi:gamma-glutamyltranspeptidase/glutathione hydrolase
LEELEAMGHESQFDILETTYLVVYGENRGLLFGGGQAVERAQRGYVAGSDSRRDGLAAAY